MKIITRPFLFAVGSFFVLLGVVGVILPVLPTVPFMILALWCFARSSQKFHDWLYNHKIFGNQLQLWDKHGVIPLTGKITAVLSMSLSFLYLAFFREMPIGVLLSVFCIMAYAAYYVLSKPSCPPK